MGSFEEVHVSYEAIACLGWRGAKAIVWRGFRSSFAHRHRRRWQSANRIFAFCEAAQDSRVFRISQNLASTATTICAEHRRNVEFDGNMASGSGRLEPITPRASFLHTYRCVQSVYGASRMELRCRAVPRAGLESGRVQVRIGGASAEQGIHEKHADHASHRSRSPLRDDEEWSTTRHR